MIIAIYYLWPVRKLLALLLIGLLQMIDSYQDREPKPYASLFAGSV